jgi:FkbM family methyltransferase
MSSATQLQPETVEGVFKHPGGELHFRLFNNPVCIRISEEILDGKTYPEVPFVKGVKTIVDVGANIGAACVWLAATYSAATVYAFEPGSRAFALLQENTATLANVRTFPFGLFSSEKTVSLYPGRNDSVESSVLPTGRTGEEGESIQLRSAPATLADQGIGEIDILKLDTEGCEVPILRSLVDYLPSAKLIYVEYHSERDRRLIDEIMSKTHVLWRAQVPLVFRGEFCYLRRDLLPPEKETHTCEILLPLD